MLEKKIAVPEGVEAITDGKRITVKGKKGVIEKDFGDPKFLKTVSIEKSGQEMTVRSSKDTRKHRAMVGTIEAHLKNMFLGASGGYKYTMRIFYTHFPINITAKDGELQIRNFLGEKGARTAKIVGKTDVKVEKDELVLTGPWKEDLGQTAANIERACKILKRDRRIFQDGIYLTSREAGDGK
ncbi:MAG: 50S ribosomal protein L6 [Candidatus Aenigmarchaeota archaeon]|nr:50S ribosomal protein L6 [Candidatus Aenigmarchaeota archaeon]